MVFARVPAGTDLKIYTVSGELVRVLHAEVDGGLPWDFLNTAGEAVSPGLYYFVAKTASGDQKGKFMVQP